jgi:hypothetical protein
MASRPPLVQAFRDFAFRITPGRPELELIEARAESVRQSVHDLAGDLHKLFPLLQRHCPGHLGTPYLKYIGTFAFGSAQRGTLIRPIEAIDVDMLVLFEAPPIVMNQFDDGQNFLRAMLDLLQDLPGETALFEGECIRIDFDTPPLFDIFPAVDWFGQRSTYMFPHGGRNTWYRSNPFVLDRLTMKRNAKLQRRLTLMLRMLKVWNRYWRVGLRSFHLETLAIRKVKELHGYWPIEIEAFLEIGAQKGAGFLSTRLPGDRRVDLAKEMSNAEKTHVIERFRDAAHVLKEGNRAGENRDYETAVGLYRSVFGDPFPEWHSLAAEHGY